MTALLLALLVFALPLLTLILIAAGACLRELRALREDLAAGLAALDEGAGRRGAALVAGLAALDEGAGRRGAALAAGLAALRDPLEAVRAGLEELSPNRRETVEQRAPQPLELRGPQSLEPRGPQPPPRPTLPEPTGLRLDLPRATDDDRDSDGETRLVRQPTAAELAAAGARRPVSGPRRTGKGTLMSVPAQAMPPSGSAPRAGIRMVCRMCEGSGVVRMRDGALEDCRGCYGAGYVDPADVPAECGDEREARLPG